MTIIPVGAIPGADVLKGGSVILSGWILKDGPHEWINRDGPQRIPILSPLSNPTVIALRQLPIHRITGVGLNSLDAEEVGPTIRIKVSVHSHF